MIRSVFTGEIIPTLTVSYSIIYNAASYERRMLSVWKRFKVNQRSLRVNSDHYALSYGIIVLIAERHDKGVGNYDVVSSCESNNSNSKSEYFAAISPTAITSQPYPQMNFSRNGGILTMINDQAVIDSENGNGGCL